MNMEFTLSRLPLQGSQVDDTEGHLHSLRSYPGLSSLRFAYKEFASGFIIPSVLEVRTGLTPRVSKAPPHAPDRALQFCMPMAMAIWFQPVRSITEYAVL